MVDKSPSGKNLQRIADMLEAVVGQPPKVTVRVVPGGTFDWPAGWPLPRVGDTVDADEYGGVVRSVNWYPTNSHSDPQVYIVIARP